MLRISQQINSGQGGFGGFGGFGGGGLSPSGSNALGGILDSVGSLFGGPTQSEIANSPEAFRNKFRSGALDFLGRGGGVQNAQEIAKGERANFLNRVLGTSGIFSPETTAARAGRGPGGGLGVFSDIPQFLKENDPEFEELPGQSLLKKILQTGLKVGGAFLGGGI